MKKKRNRSRPALPLQDRLRQLAFRAREMHSPVATGKFGAKMQVSLTNDGPVTIWLRVEP